MRLFAALPLFNFILRLNSLKQAMISRFRPMIARLLMTLLSLKELIWAHMNFITSQSNTYLTRLQKIFVTPRSSYWDRTIHNIAELKNWWLWGFRVKEASFSYQTKSWRIRGFNDPNSFTNTDGANPVQSVKNVWASWALNDDLPVSRRTALERRVERNPISMLLINWKGSDKI